MIITDAGLEPGRRSGGLNSAEQALVDQDTERVVYRLTRDRADYGPDIVGQLVGGGVGTSSDGHHQGEPLRRHLDATEPEKLLHLTDIMHG